MSAKLTATVTIEIPASQAAAEAAQAAQEARKPGEWFVPSDLPEWTRSERQAEIAAMAKTESAMKGWRRSRTDVGIFWCSLRGWCHQFQTYWERGA